MKLQYYFSTTSPFCYYGNKRIFDMEKEFGIKWELKPYVIEQPADSSPPDPKELKHMTADIRRLAGYYKLELTFPKGPPKGSLHKECFFIANDAGKGKKYLIATNHAFWGKGIDISEINVLADIAKSIGLDEKEFREKSGDPSLKERLKKSTEEGNADGVFGVPTLIVGNELFWGQDRLELVRAELAKVFKK
ncbi:MAG: 2-hydroxychromene-2-carboxylate isomerase [Candidatus Schekmanbacteria bacterium]|nr:2-hydroxychromene-2-carboxylate isomerase [Candidatus Schekmanbacteria bacterium]